MKSNVYTSSGISWLARNIRLANFGWFKSKAKDKCNFNDDKRWFWLAKKSRKTLNKLFDIINYLPVTKASRRYNDKSSSSSQTRTFLHRVAAKHVTNVINSSVKSLPSNWLTSTFNSRTNAGVNTLLIKEELNIFFDWNFLHTLIQSH